MISLGYFADGPWAHRAFELFLKRENVKIVFFVPRYDTQDEYLISLCQERGIPVLKLKNVNSKESIRKISSYGANLFVSMSFNQILKKDILNTGVNFINCHAGLLPEYRGRNVLNWAMINGEKEFGITVHHVDEGIDTGDIILQEKVEILDTDYYSDVLNKAVEKCATTLDRAIQLLETGIAERIKQDTIGPGFYCSKREEGDEIINWNSKSEKVVNFIKALAPPSIGAHCFYRKKPLVLLEAEVMDFQYAHVGRCGVVTRVDKDGVCVKTLDGEVLIKKIRHQGKEITPSFPIGSKLKGINDLILDIVLEKNRSRGY